MYPRARRLRSTLALAAGLTVLLTACGGTDDAASGDAANSAPKKGGTLTLALQQSPQSANPRAFTDTGAVYVNRQLFDSLVNQDPETGKIVPWLAKSWEINKDATEFTFHLREGVTFSDGTPLTAEVVKANFDDLVANKAKVNPSIAPTVSAFTEASVVDPATVTVSFSKPNAPFLVAASQTGLSLVAPATLKLPWDKRVDNVIGSGPFVLDTFAPGQVTLSKRKGYDWSPGSVRHTGDAYLDKVVFKVVPEASVRTGSLESGQVQAVSDVPPGDIASVRDNGLKLVTRPNPGLVWGLVPISARKPLDDVRVRKAIALSVDRTEVRDAVLSPDFKPATSVLASTTPGYTDLGSVVKHDPTEAGKLLDTAGWTRSGDGVRAKDGKKLSLVVGWFPGYTASQKTLELIKAQLAENGIELKLLQQTGLQILDGLKQEKYDFFWTNGTQADGDVLRTSFSGAPPNYYRINDTTLEPLLQEQVATGDPAARNKILAQAQRRIVEEVVYLPVFEQTTVVATGKQVHGLTLGAGAGLNPLTPVWLS
ncbi:ABC transporter substrate-binding protein [Streptomyces sp. NPDC058463]|uniref:ABC transporter substrate-binding protein n=1 Tax=Streptomyces sp. NPDC058463 TaxID=3346510 RepID=UPI003663243E